MEILSESWGYFIQGGGFLKIGIAKNPRQRLRELQTGCPYALELIAAFRGDTETEKLLHRRFAHLHSQGEWFRATREILEFAQKAGYEQFAGKNIKWGDGYFAVVDSGYLKAPSDKEHYFTVLLCDNGKDFACADFLPGKELDALYDGIPVITHEEHGYVPLNYLERETGLDFSNVRKLIQTSRKSIENLKT